MDNITNEYAFDYDPSISVAQNYSRWRSINISERAAYGETQMTEAEAVKCFQSQYGVNLGEGQQ